MKQGRRGFGTYLLDFQQALVDAGATTWSDQQKIDAVEAGAHIDLIKSVAPIPRKPTGFKERMAYYQEVWDQIVMLDSSYSRKGMKQSKKDSLLALSKDPDTMDWTKTSRAGIRTQ